ncbi:hypothetical protein AKJ65_06835 [candidate division MSBL1 archaeon SCGC-AAA259E19]|uniref:Ribbon-helix-helix protein CopG domain-containing protein n=1 Tax=candidate division MSBL1 archaeon SCGC-AAA259E19 TaxID=1698264 RepID=A0A133UFG7_9EURY|nr:hypothetical protein AKJ65_06835 [candidate division MSBL1 archaeon SCGC-AAA259E19]
MSTISAKIPERLKRELEDEGINISETVRKSLEDELKRRRRKRLRERAEDLRLRLREKIDAEQMTAMIRETRGEH